MKDLLVRFGAVLTALAGVFMGSYATAMYLTHEGSAEHMGMVLFFSALVFVSVLPGMLVFVPSAELPFASWRSGTSAAR